MASVSLETFWMMNAADPTDFLGLEHVTVLAPQTTVSGEVREYANGRFRAVVSPTLTRSYDVTVEHAPRRDVQWIEGHVATLLLIRDPMGRMFYGLYLSVKPSERRGEDQADVSFTVQEISRDESV